jgi:hypothetical protein
LKTLSEKKCDKPGLLQEYLDSNANAGLKSELDRHLSACDVCRKDFEAYQQLFQSLDETLKPPLVKPAPERLKKIREALENQKISTAQHPESWIEGFLAAFTRPFALAFSVLLIAGLVTIVFRNRQTEPVSPDKSPSIAQTTLNLEKNSVEIILPGSGNNLLIDGKNERIDKLKTIAPGLVHELPTGAAMFVYAGQSRIKLSDSAKFNISANDFELVHGRAEFKLIGKHDDFKLVTEFARVQVLGTVFSALKSNDHLLLKLDQGKISIKTSNGSVMMLNQPGQSCKIDAEGRFIDSEGSAPSISQPIHNGSKDVPSDKKLENKGDSGRKLENSF